MHGAFPQAGRGLLLGDGLFETILACGGRLMLLDAHLERLARGCATLGLPAPDLARARRSCQAALRQAGDGRLAVRLTLTCGSGGRGLDRPGAPAMRLFTSVSAVSPVASPARLATAMVRRNEGSVASRLKTLSYIDNVLARREATLSGADEAVMLNNRGEVAGAAAANLFWMADGRLLTPALECGTLDGIMRRQVIDRSRRGGIEVREVREGPKALASADAVFLTNSLVGVRGVCALDGQAIHGERIIARAAGVGADVAGLAPGY